METEYVYMFKNSEEKLRGAQWISKQFMRDTPLTELLGASTCTKTHLVFPVTRDLNQIETDVKLDTIEEFAEQVFILNLEN